MFHSSDVDRPVLPPYYYYVSNSKETINGAALIPRFGSGNLAPVAGGFRYLSLPGSGSGSGSDPGLGLRQTCLPLNQSLPPNCLPPLLPLPVSKPQSGSLSGPLTKTTRSDPRKKSKKKPCKEQTLKSDNTKVVLSPRPGRQVVIKVSSSTSNPPKHQLPTNKVSHNVSTRSDGCVKEIDEQYDDKFSGGGDRAVFTLSPPPSSLPLPTFSLRPKLRRSAPAAGNPEQRN
nr:uncharacterized protein LOC109169920 [Ipomoea trifida]